VVMPAAGIPPTKPAVGGGELVVSLFGLRHSVPLLLEAAGATLREVMTFMRHSDPKLTMKTYGRIGRHELAAVAKMMPALLPLTADIPSDFPLTSPRRDAERGIVRKVEETTGLRVSAGGSSEVLELKVGEDNREVLTRGDESSPSPPVSEPTSGAARGLAGQQVTAKADHRILPLESARIRPFGHHYRAIC
jgi:hypothetical protein